MSEQKFRKIFFNPQIMTIVFISVISGAVIVNVIIDTFGLSLYTPVLIFGLLVVISLFETWWLNFQYSPSK